jgi:5-methyltetrahydropteroyltriglutamate--homocysteine methyltransferase
MLYSTDRILTTHAGSLPRPADLREMIVARTDGQPFDAAALDRRLSAAVAEVVKQQLDSGLDIVNDGELSKFNFTDYVRERIAGYELRPSSGRRRLSIIARDERKFAGYFAANARAQSLGPPTMPVCVASLRYVGQADLQKDIDNFRAALAGASPAGAFLPANSPGTIEHWMANEYYKTDEEFVFAIAEAMNEEYRAIVDAGFLLQIDDPDLPDGWNCLPDITLPDYRKYATVRVDALNHALRGIPREKVRLHVCWGSFHGPHYDDIPLRDIIDLIFRVDAGSYSIEARPGVFRSRGPFQFSPHWGVTGALTSIRATSRTLRPPRLSSGTTTRRWSGSSSWPSIRWARMTCLPSNSGAISPRASTARYPSRPSIMTVWDTC